MKDRIREAELPKLQVACHCARRVPGLAKRETGPYERTPLLMARVIPNAG